MTRLLMFAIVAVLCVAMDYCHGLSLRNEYDRISSYLETELPETDEIAPNMIALKVYLDTKLNRNSILDRQLIKAIKLLLLLETMKVSTSCDRDGYLALANNLQAMGSQVLKKSDSKRRVDKILYRCSVYHAISCQSVYVTFYESVYSHLNPEQVQLAETFTDAIVEQALDKGVDYYTNDNERMYDKFVVDGFELNRPDHVKVAIETILAHSEAKLYKSLLRPLPPSTGTGEQNLQETKKQRKTKLKEMFLRFIQQPCEYYAKGLGETVFEPATYDAQFHYDPEARDLRFHQAWARYQICNALAKDDKHTLWKNIVDFVFKGTH